MNRLNSIIALEAKFSIRFLLNFYRVIIISLARCHNIVSFMIAIFWPHFDTRSHRWQSLCLHILSLWIEFVLISMFCIRFGVDSLQNIFISTFDATSYAFSLSILKAANLVLMLLPIYNIKPGKAVI